MGDLVFLFVEEKHPIMQSINSNDLSNIIQLLKYFKWTPVQAAAFNDWDNISIALISKAAHFANNEKTFIIIHNLATNGVKKENLINAIRLKRPAEVFQLFDCAMKTHIIVSVVMLSVTGPFRAEYHSRGIQWLKNKTKQHIEEDIVRFRKRSKKFKALVVQNLDSVFRTSRETSTDYNTRWLYSRETFLNQQSPASEEYISDGLGDSSTTSVQESVANDLQPGNTTFRKEQKWLKRSVRWREKLEKLSKSEEIIKVGSILFVNDAEYRIATGSDGTEVFLGLREDGTEVAVKRMSKTNDNVLKNEESFLRLPELHHENIVRYVDSAEDENYVYLAHELYEGNLEELVKHDLTEEQKSKPVKEVLISLLVLHRQTPPILHLDVKPQNFLLDVWGKLRLAGLGISRRLPIGATTLDARGAGTKCWMARENIDEDVFIPCNMSADIQVAGMLIYYILSGGYHPFGSGSTIEGSILDGLYSLEHVQDPITKDLVKWMINKNPNERPTVQQCLAHPFFWSRPSKKIEYLKEIGNQEEVKKYRTTEESFVVLQGELDRVVGEATWKDWKQKFAPELVQKLDGNRKNRISENTAGLLRFIRNLHEHHPEDAENIDLMATFPDLFGRVYIFAKNNDWNIRFGLREMFQEE